MKEDKEEHREEHKKAHRKRPAQLHSERQPDRSTEEVHKKAAPKEDAQPAHTDPGKPAEEEEPVRRKKPAKAAELEAMNNHELLLAIAKEQAAAQRHRRVIAVALTVIAAAVLVSCIAVVPRLLDLIRDADQASVSATQLIEQTQPAVSAMNEIDFEGLNEAIGNLRTAVQNLADFLNVFN